MRELLKLLVVLTTGIFIIGATTIAHSQEDFLHRLKRSLNPQMAATHDFQAAAEAYKHCAAIKPLEACEPERQIMNGYAAALAAINSRPLPNPPPPIR
jgi:hypothetical protein